MTRCAWKGWTAGLLLACASPIQASETPPMDSRDDFIDTWSSVMYCGAVYQQDRVKGRVYPGDHQQCLQADRYMREQLPLRLPSEKPGVIEAEAQQKARAVAQNTRDIQEAVNACRQHCRALASDSDQDYN